MAATGPAGTYSNSSGAANTNQGEGTASGGPKKRKRNGVVEFQWKNGSWHSRQQGAEFRSNHDSSGSGSGGGGGGGSPTVHHSALQNELNAAVDLRYGDESRGLIQQQQGLPSWFDQYRAALAKARTDTASLYQTGQPVGGAVPEVTDPNNIDQQAAANRASLSNAFSGLMHDQGANIETNYSQQAANSSLQEAGQQLAVGKDLKALRAEKGSFRTDWLRQRREDNRQYNLEAGALGVKQDAAAQDILSEQNAIITSGAFQGFTHQQVRDLDPDTKASIRAAAKTTTPDKAITSGAFAGKTQGDLAGMTDAQKQKLVDKYNKLTHPGKSATNKGKDRNGNTQDKRRANNNSWLKSFTQAKSYGTPDSDLQSFLTDHGVPADIAKIRSFKAKHGFITPQMAKSLKRLSVKYTGKVQALGGGNTLDRPGAADTGSTNGSPYT